LFLRRISHPTEIYKEFPTMSFTAFGRGCEQNGSSSVLNLTSVSRRTVILPSPSSNGGTNGDTEANGKGNGQNQPNGRNGHAEPHGNGNGHARPNGNGHAAAPAPDRRIPALRTTLSSGVSIKGSVKCRSEVEIDGDVEGTIESTGCLTVGKNARVRGDIQTRSVTVHGTVDGNLSVGDKCELRSGCTLRGDIETARLVMDENVNFTGNAAIATRDYLAELRPLNGNGNCNQHGHA
jgi:cytoskeletal protein CcmA (bactofilin family)